jgi:two-component system, chemotaxis family, sensor kinase CheA
MGMYDNLGDMLEVVDDFVVETNELLDELNEDLLQLEAAEDDNELINRVFRAFHTIKGTSSFLDFKALSEIAHSAENLLDQIRNHQLSPNADIVDILLETADWIRGFIGYVERREEFDKPADYLIEAFQRHSKGKSAAAPEEDDNFDELFKANNNENGAETEKTEFIQLNAPQELIDEFIAESSEQLELMGADLLSMEIEPDNAEIVNTLFRAFHTLKGNSSLLGALQLSEMAHKAEDVLGRIRDKKLVPDSHLIDVLLSVVDKAKDFIEMVKQNQLSEQDISYWINNLNVLLGEKPVAPSRKKETAQKKPEKKAADSSEKKELKKSSDSSKKQDTIRVDVDRVDKLLNLVGELVLEKNRLLQINRQLIEKYSGNKEIDDLDGVNNSMGHITTELQEGIMKVRMLPIANVFRKFPRLVRDLAKDKNKEIDLVIQGGDTELDRSVIEAIGDPLVHLLRNAVDHGVENPDIRKRKGKSATGTITLEAYQEGNHIVIKISDDGAGIDPQKIAKKAIEKGLITDSDYEMMSDRDVVNLIFKPGFSTAEKITDVSGRGVGMDVVHSNISRLNGTVEIDSQIDRGTAFIVKLPLTLTIMSGMVVKVYDEVYIIPLTSIAETLKYNPRMISHVRGQEVLRLRNSVLPLLRMEKILHVPMSREISDKERYIVVVNVAEKLVGLVVTGLLGQEETVVKSLGHTLGKVLHLTGATIRGDGKVNLILDVPEIIETCLG